MAASPSQPFISSESFALPFTHRVKTAAAFFSSFLGKDGQKSPTFLYSGKYPTPSLPGLLGSWSPGAAAVTGLQSPAQKQPSL